MLEAMRQNSRSAIIYILFGILIAAFIISFGPGATTGSTGALSGTQFAARVSGSEVTEQDFRFAYVAMGAGNLPGNMAREQRIKEFIMDRLIDRELFAAEAERLGLAASEKEVNDMLLSGRMMVLGMQRRLEGYVYKDNVFDYDRFRMVAQNHYGLNVKKLTEVQRRELLADKMRELLRLSTKVSPDEVKADFEDKGRQANLEYVRFTPRRYEEEISPAEADLENFARSHEAPIKKLYEERKASYQKQEPSVRLRRILIEIPREKAKDAAKDDQEETARKDDAAGPQGEEARKAEIAAREKAAREKLEAAEKTLKSGTRFADVARTESEDTHTRVRGGDMGWLKKGFTGLGEDVESRVFAAKAGDLVGPLRTSRGLELFKIEGFRQGDISLAAATPELAEELYREEKTRERARAAAAEAARKARAGARLAELYPKADSDADEAKPRLGQKGRVQAEETGLFSRRGDVVQGLGPSAELVKLAFGALKPGDVVGPLEIGGSFVVAALKERKEPDLADWDKRKAEIVAEYQRTKAQEVLMSWSRQRCTAENAAGRIQVNLDTLAYEGPAKGPLAMLERKYEPCSGQRPF